MFCVKLQSVYRQVFFNHTTNHISTKFKEFNFNLSYEYYEYVQICIVHLQSVYRQVFLNHTANHISTKFKEFNFNLPYEYYEYVQICILHLCTTLSQKNHTIRYFTYRHTPTMTKHHFAYD